MSHDSVYSIVVNLSRKNFKNNHTLNEYYSKANEILNNLKNYVKNRSLEELYEDKHRIEMALKVNSTYREINPMPYAMTGLLGMVTVIQTLGVIEDNLALKLFFTLSMLLLLSIASIYSIKHLLNHPVIEVNNFIYQEALVIIDSEITSR